MGWTAARPGLAARARARATHDAAMGRRPRRRSSPPGRAPGGSWLLTQGQGAQGIDVGPHVVHHLLHRSLAHAAGLGPHARVDVCAAREPRGPSAAGVTRALGSHERLWPGRPCAHARSLRRARCPRSHASQLQRTCASKHDGLQGQALRTGACGLAAQARRTRRADNRGVPAVCGGPGQHHQLAALVIACQRQHRGRPAAGRQGDGRAAEDDPRKAQAVADGRGA